MLIDLITLTPISGRNSNNQIEIASLTKIMTSYLCLLICRKYNVDVYTYATRVGEKASETPGTTAELQNGDSLTIYELLHALMLPSGNDASVAIA
jgi:serine-type D-Ala-D-Ala carboxypeptidase (penicillin-binding protein 5/6)